MFLSGGVSPDRADEYALFAGSRELVALGAECHIRRGAWPRPLPGSEKWETLEPWNATYWKTLAVGYRFSFRFASQHALNPAPTSEELTDARDACGKLNEIQRGWHKAIHEVWKSFNNQ
jgi:hypothetical protein